MEKHRKTLNVTFTYTFLTSADAIISNAYLGGEVDTIKLANLHYSQRNQVNKKGCNECAQIKMRHNSGFWIHDFPHNFLFLRQSQNTVILLIFVKKKINPFLFFKFGCKCDTISTVLGWTPRISVRDSVSEQEGDLVSIHPSVTQTDRFNSSYQSQSLRRINQTNHLLWLIQISV